MPGFPSSTGSAIGLEIAYPAAKRLSSRVKSGSVDVRNAAAAGTLKRFETLKYMTRLTDALVDFTTYRSVPGIVEFARADTNDPTRDITIEFTTMMNAITAARDWIITNYPVSLGDFRETFKITAGRFNDPGFPVGSVSLLVPLLDAIIASID